MSTVEEALAVGQATWINGAVVLFLEKVEQVNQLVETGTIVSRMFEPVLVETWSHCCVQ